ncbi:hypothetical protein BJV74DRAFT_303641 [Russula compacta]|nr:hypothetical protein BJV74DRAFT_303641 [Russula compacta]
MWFNWVCFIVSGPWCAGFNNQTWPRNTMGNHYLVVVVVQVRRPHAATVTATQSSIGHVKVTGLVAKLGQLGTVHIPMCGRQEAVRRTGKS